MSLGANKQALMGAAGASGGSDDFYSYQIANSVRMSKSGGSTLKITAGTPTSGKTFTYSWWWKRYSVTDTATNSTNVFTAGTGGATYVFFTFTNGSTMQANFNFTGGNFGDNRIETDMLFRDTSAWYHCVLRFDSTQSTASNRVRLYVNGVEPTYADASVQTAIAQDGTYSFMNQSGVVQSWGGLSGVGTGSEGVDVQLADVILCDGQSYAPTEFGETKNGVWIPKDPSGLTFGNNGYYLKFTNSSDFGEDFSGNNNDLTAANLATHDQMLDTPTFGSSNGGNYCTMNPLNSGSNNTFSEGNLKVVSTGGGCTALGTMSLVTGHKWYFEGKCTGSGNNWIGIIEENGYTNSANTNSSIAGSASFNTYLYAHNGSIYYGSSSTATGATFSTDDIIGVLVDLESATNTIQFYKNGAAQGSAFNLTGTGINYTPMSDRGSSTGNGFWFNFGQEGTFGTGSGGGNSDVNGYGSFYYNDGASAKAICTGNLPIADAINPSETDDNYPQKLFGAKTYTGNGSTNNITGLGFQPDLTWIKIRNTASNGPLVDSSRGTNKIMFSQNDDSEVTSANLTSFDSDGFSLAGGLASYDANFNGNSNTYASWSWRANGGTTSTNSTGSISVTQQVDPSGAFSISTYSGAGGTKTIGHGLSAAPTFVVVKQRNGANNWTVYAKGAGNEKYAYMDNANAFGDSTIWADTTPSSSLVYLGDANNVNHSGRTYLAYCFADIEGYCKSGSYVGNGNADGSFVYTGFRPALVTTKRTDGSGSWLVHDNARNTSNVTDKILLWNDSGAEFSGSNDKIDMLSNGFKVKSSNAGINGNNNDYIYAAWAENPFKFAVAR